MQTSTQPGETMMKRHTTLRRTAFVTALAVSALAAASCGTTDNASNGAGGTAKYVCADPNNQALDCKATVQITEGISGLEQKHNSKYSVQVGNIQTGSASEIRFTIRNTAAEAAAAELRVEGIKLIYEPSSQKEDQVKAFECWDATGTKRCDEMDLKWKKVVPTGAANGADKVLSEQFMIRYTRHDNLARTAQVVLLLVGDPAYDGKPYVIRLATQLGAAKLAVQPSTVAFNEVKPGDSKSEFFKIVNNGDTLLEVNKADFLGNPTFELKLKANDGTVLSLKSGSEKPLVIDPPISIPKGELYDAEVVFSPKDDKGKQGTILLGSNDPDPESGKVLVQGNANLPCMLLKPTGKVNFGGVKLGDPTPRDVVIENCGGTELVVTKIDLGEATNSDEFSFDFKKTVAKFPSLDAKGPTEANPIKIGLNDDATFSVIYTPEDESPIDKSTGQPKPDIAEVRVHSNAFSAKNTVLCEGVGVTSVCPTAKVIVNEGEEVIPQTMLHLKGDQSKGTGGAQVKKYKWTVKQPAGSNQVFVPGSNFPNPTFTANAAGEYEFCLEVWDENDVKSCNPACVKVLVLPEEAIHVELLWKTPADPDETDTGPAAGADMDLHFAHPLAGGPDIDCDGEGDPWFSNPFDTFWFNPNPNWGSASPTVNDDPSLDLDDTDGAGPENLNLDDPEGKLGKPIAYDVGVHYWNDHGFGTSFATVNVYIMGVLAVQIEKVEMGVLDMWYVGKINWPNSMSGGVLSPFKICYKTKDGDPCKKTGKFWQPQGDWCLTKCYVNPAFTATQSGASKAACKP